MDLLRFLGAYVGSLIGGQIGLIVVESLAGAVIGFGLSAVAGMFIVEYILQPTVESGVQGMILGIKRGISASAGGAAGIYLLQTGDPPE